MAANARRMTGPLARKSIEALQADATSHGLRRTLGPLHLMLLGIGCILGAGIYVLPGTAAANFAGPAVMISFVIAGTACALTALCYAELASTMPVSGSSYSYCYAALGEVFAWGLGWILMLEYTLASSSLAVGFSSYLVSLLRDFDVVVPAVIATPLVGSGDGFSMNLLAVLAIVVVTGVLCAGVRQSAGVNAFLVVVKVAVLAVVISVGVSAIDPGNWKPFIPPNEGGFAFGWPGIVRAASILFFAYLGFETVSTAASESRNPQRDMPIGIIGSLVICTILYIGVVIVLTGMVKYDQLHEKAAVSEAFGQVGMPWAKGLIAPAALAGLTSVILVSLLGSTRVIMSMSRDGLLPPFFSAIHSSFKTPAKGTIVIGFFVALMAGFLPLNVLLDLTNIGTLFAFAVVCGAVLVMRYTNPTAPRPFRVPGVWVIAPLGIALCLLLMLSLKPENWYRLIGWMGVGLLIYFLYGRSHSLLGKSASA